MRATGNRVCAQRVVQITGALAAVLALSTAAVAAAQSSGPRPGGSVGALVEELVLGGPNTSSTQQEFSQVVSVAVDSRNRIVIVDLLAARVVVFDDRGRFVREVGRKGQGPGEFTAPRAVAIAPSGQVVIADPRGVRILVYDSAGVPIRTIDAPGIANLPAGSLVADPMLIVDPRGIIWAAHEVRSPTRASGAQVPLRLAFVRMTLDGRIVDTVFTPLRGQDSPVISAQAGPNTVTMAVPFTKRSVVALSPLGFFLFGDGNGENNSYTVQTVRTASGDAARGGRSQDTAVYRVSYSPVPVNPDERRDWRSSLEAYFRWRDPRWSWNGPQIPVTKPAYKGLWADADARTWVTRYAAATRDGSAGARPDTGPGGQPDYTWSRKRWPEPVEYDVVDSTGRLIGRVRAPELIRPQHARGDRLWAITFSEYGMLTVKRFRIQW